MLRALLLRAVLLTAAGLPALYAGVIPSRPTNEITILTRSEYPLSAETRVALEEELNILLSPAALVPVLRDMDAKTPSEQFNELVVVTVRGPCAFDLRTRRSPLPGPLAAAHSTDGYILPFIDVACERIRDAVQPSLRGSHFGRLPALFGRAMARVLAHELYHVLGRTKKHGDSALTAERMSAQQLLADRVHFEDEDLEKISAAGGA